MILKLFRDFNECKNLSVTSQWCTRSLRNERDLIYKFYYNERILSSQLRNVLGNLKLLNVSILSEQRDPHWNSIRSRRNTNNRIPQTKSKLHDHHPTVSRPLFLLVWNSLKDTIAAENRAAHITCQLSTILKLVVGDAIPTPLWFWWNR